MKTTFTKPLLGLALAALLLGACKKDKVIPPPSVTTAAASAITTTSATVGGNATGEGITEVGIVYSKTNSNPTTSDSKIPAALNNGSFSANLTGLSTGSTYYIRAYAINASGTSYGGTLSFMTGNAAPEAKSVKIDGNKTVGATLTASYTYSDSENDAENGSTYQWYAANDSIGATVTPISGATNKTYVLSGAEQNKFIYVGVTPKAATGTTPGTEGKSYWFGPIGGETVTFTYNGKQVTYGVIISSVTGKKWLDRNLGAPNSPSAWDDWANYGDLFQWGRGDDGHQLINMAADAASTTSVNGTTTTLATSNTPGTNKFILGKPETGDWINPQNNNLWQAPNYLNNPCPQGWHVPTKTEWDAEAFNSDGDGNIQAAYSRLKLTKARNRYNDTGEIWSNSGASYWTSTAILDAHAPVFVSAYVRSLRSTGGYSDEMRGEGHVVRCIKN